MISYDLRGRTTRFAKLPTHNAHVSHPNYWRGAWMAAIAFGVTIASAGCGDSTEGATNPDAADTMNTEDTSPRSCATESDCGVGELCRDSVCRLGCETGEDCPDSHSCEDAACVPPATVCVAESTRCSGLADAVLTCTSDGSAETSEPCGETRGCRVEGAGAACAAVVCEANTLGCQDSENTSECDPSGTVETITACGEASVCAGGVCVAQTCTPDEVFCAGAGVRTCARDGLSAPYATCAVDTECQDAVFGCACTSSACEPRLCTPSSTRCVEGALERCWLDGSAWQPAGPCTDGESCVAELGACAPATCTPGATSCYNEVLAECDVNGTGWTTIDCKSNDQICVNSVAAAACADYVCEPDSLTCNAAGTSVVACDVRGAAVDIFPCSDTRVCAGGSCILPVGGCPTAVITVAEGPEVVPGTVLHLSAFDSIAAVGDIGRWEWSVSQPSGGNSIFFPSNSHRFVTFEVNVVGEYIFRLKVWDTSGNITCQVATYRVLVVSDTAIRVELTWDTPGDADQGDTGFDGFGESVGSDLDLHFLHPLAEGEYFNVPYDTYWKPVEPNAGGQGTAATPVMLRDDTDGAGPEVIVVVRPEDGATYRVGVHYWNDWGFGGSFATIRVYIHGELREEWGGVELVTADLWDALTIEWPSLTITRLKKPDGKEIITRGYENGVFP